MINAYSQRILNPYSGHVQIVESEQARAVSLDGENWEIHFLKMVEVKSAPVRKKAKSMLRRIVDFFMPIENSERVSQAPEYRKAFAKVGKIKHSDFETIVSEKNEKIDGRVLELADFLLTASLPFPANDRFEYWLLDRNDGSPLALIHSCSNTEEQADFRINVDWTALPAAEMPIEKNEDEQSEETTPVNYRFERLVAEYAGTKPQGRWFERHAEETDTFPPLLVKEDWQDEAQYELCQRYLQRLSPRLLMLHGLSDEDRRRVELAAKSQSLEVAKYFPLYPGVGDKKVMDGIRVEARLRQTMGEEVYSVKYRWS